LISLLRRWCLLSQRYSPMDLLSSIG